MKRLCYAPAALADLREIAPHIAEDDPQRPMTFVSEVEERAIKAASGPLGFPERADISPGLRAIDHGRYLIFFRDLVDEVSIVRVGHGARDLPRLFNP